MCVDESPQKNYDGEYKCVLYIISPLFLILLLPACLLLPVFIRMAKCFHVLFSPSHLLTLFCFVFYTRFLDWKLCVFHCFFVSSTYIRYFVRIVHKVRATQRYWLDNYFFFFSNIYKYYMLITTTANLLTLYGGRTISLFMHLTFNII